MEDSYIYSRKVRSRIYEEDEDEDHEEDHEEYHEEEDEDEEDKEEVDEEDEEDDNEEDKEEVEDDSPKDPILSTKTKTIKFPVYRSHILNRKNIVQTEKLEIDSSDTKKNEICRFCFQKHRITGCFVKNSIYNDREDEISHIRRVALSKGISFQIIENTLMEYLREYIPFYPIIFTQKSGFPSRVKEMMIDLNLRTHFPDKYIELMKVKHRIEHSRLISIMKKCQSSYKCQVCDSVYHQTTSCSILNFMYKKIPLQIKELYSEINSNVAYRLESVKFSKRMHLIRSLYHKYIQKCVDDGHFHVKLPHIVSMNYNLNYY
jgi:hypothetical protein